MKSTFKWVSLCLLVYLVFLVIKLPAVQVVSKVPLGKDVRISGVTGTIWHGHAQRAIINGLPVSDLSWSLAFFPLLIGEINAEVKAGNVRDLEQISVNGEVSVKGQRLVINDLLAYIPTNLVIGMLPLPIPVQADGRFKVQLDAVDYEEGCHEFKGNGQWLNANYTGTAGVIDLGNFTADFSCNNSNIVVEVKQPNSFGLSATTLIPANMQYKITGRFKPQANLPKEVHQAAQFFGNPDSEGYYPIQF